MRVLIVTGFAITVVFLIVLFLAIIAIMRGRRETKEYREAVLPDSIVQKELDAEIQSDDGGLESISESDIAPVAPSGSVDEDVALPNPFMDQEDAPGTDTRPKTGGHGRHAAR